MSRRVHLPAVVLAALLAVAPITAAAGELPATPGSPPDQARLAADRLSADGKGPITVDRGSRGDVEFVGVAANADLDNPAVTPSTSVAAAANAQLARYGPAMGTARAGTTLVKQSTVHTASGHDLVRYAQHVGGLPVIGGDVVVNLRPDRELGSLLATMSAETAVSTPAVDESVAARTAQALVARDSGVAAVTATSQGRWLFDPAVFGADSGLGARSVWRIEVGNGVEVRRLVLVDDQNGRVLLNIDLIEHIDRVVCDNANVQVAIEAPCTSSFARTEASGPSGVSDVNQAFDHAGEVSTYYQTIGGIDLTALLGIDIGGGNLRLAATVRQCFSGGPACPYSNAFWNGSQMYYGQGFAVADDVVGHEMTHGVIDQYSELFYWFQSGAINESIADIMGEIVDHRNTLVGADSSWPLGEDLSIGAIRNMKNPRLFGDPDKMTSGLYVNDEPGYSDNGGVHGNSGVGNKTAYLISQGGSFNGQTITGIDGGDTGLTKTGILYLTVIQALTSGSDYADLARVLDQSCQDLVGTSGFTAADCTNVHKATLATELRKSPPNAKQPKDAAAVCPTGSAKRVLFDSETGTPSAKFGGPNTWTRAPGAATDPSFGTYGIPSNATSGRDSWFALDTSTDSDQVPGDDGRRQPSAGPAQLPVVPALAAAGQRPRPHLLRRWHGRDRRRGHRGAGGRRRRAGVEERAQADADRSELRPQGLRRGQPRVYREPRGPDAVRRQGRQGAVHHAHGRISLLLRLVPRRHPRLHLRLDGDHRRDPEGHRPDQGGQEADGQAGGVDPGRAQLHLPVVPWRQEGQRRDRQDLQAQAGRQGQADQGQGQGLEDRLHLGDQGLEADQEDHLGPRAAVRGDW